MFYADAGVASNGGNNSDSLQGARLNASLQLEKDESDVEKAISEIIEVQVCPILNCLMVFTLVKFKNLD